jgi:hypothetical protein
VLFSPIENFVDLGLVKDEAIQGENISNGFIVDCGCISDHLFSASLQGDCTVFPMVCCTALAPECHGKLQNAIDGGAHPAVVRGEGVTGLPVVVVLLYGGMFMIGSGVQYGCSGPSCACCHRSDWP